jgi:prepilin-type N-terminal cleavage/methylation domain-containing protein
VGFTLIEIMVVIVIILLVSAATLPTIVASLAHRQASEGARIVQAALVGARDAANQSNTPSGIRLLPDPVFPLARLSDGSLDPSQILAANRIVPISPAPDYSEGLVNIYANVTQNFALAYPGDGGGNYPYPSWNNTPPANAGVLMVEESMYDPVTLEPHAPTSWFWNVRVGDKIQLNKGGPWFTIVGPMTNKPSDGNSEMFVNVGPPGTTSPLQRALFTSTNKPFTINPEFLFLVNQRDDNTNGWQNEGWDGIDNNGDNQVDELAEWEVETWGATIISQVPIINWKYIIQRRPVTVTNSREIALPAGVLIDMTTSLTNSSYPTQERSRIPAQVINRWTGCVDIMVYPNGAVAPLSIYASPALFGLGSAFIHLWLTERTDLYARSTNVTSVPYLPVPKGLSPDRFNGNELKGEYRLITIFTRSGQIVSSVNMPFDDPDNPAILDYNANLPYASAQQGVQN